jgi:hypothetical protein
MKRDIGIEVPLVTIDSPDKPCSHGDTSPHTLTDVMEDSFHLARARTIDSRMFGSQTAKTRTWLAMSLSLCPDIARRIGNPKQKGIGMQDTPYGVSERQGRVVISKWDGNISRGSLNPGCSHVFSKLSEIGRFSESSITAKCSVSPHFVCAFSP